MPRRRDIEDLNESEIEKIVSSLLEYARNKGQIYSATRFAILKHYLTLLEKILDTEIPLKNMVDDIIKLSVHEPAYYDTVWLKALQAISQALQSININVQEGKRRVLGVAKV